MNIRTVAGCAVDFAVGFSCVVTGLLVWKKQKLSVLHEYHYRNVKKEDIPAYSKAVGGGITLVGVGVAITGVLNLFKSAFWWVSLVAGFAAGLIAIIRAQKKYNGSIMN
ncbi:MAG: DUF3784 domain-containing protein [Clostridiales bacterium]|nr:DUF3784 domain-containing protein [Clostridiales bacterium]